MADNSTLVENEDVDQQTSRVQKSNNNAGDASQSDSKSRCPCTFKLEGFNIVVLAVVGFSLAITFAFVIDLSVGDHSIKQHGGVVSDSAICSQLGASFLHPKATSSGRKLSGTAVDAAVVTGLCLTLARPDIAGLGGCAQLLVHDQSTFTSTIYDGQCATGAAGGVAGGVGVPGMLAALYQAHKNHGRIPWNTLVQSVIHIINMPFKITNVMHESNSNTKHFNKALKDAYSQSVGSIFSPPSGIKTLLHQIAINGPDAFYKGPIAKEIVALVTSNGGKLTEDDLAKYITVKRKALVGHFDQQKVVTSPTWGGAFLVSTLQVLDVNKTSFVTDDLPGSYNRLVEIFKHVENSASKVGGDSESSLSQQAITHMLSKEFAEEILQKVTESYNSKLSSFTGFVKLPNTEDAGGSQIVVMDTNNTLVSMSISLTSPYGSGLATTSGVILNNALSLFATGNPGSTDNLPGPGKRPASAMSPTVVYNPRRKCGSRIALGSNHGRIGNTALVQWLVEAFLIKKSICSTTDCLDLAPATSTPRLHASLGGTPEVLAETTFPLASLSQIKKSAHSLSILPPGSSGLSDIGAIGRVQNVVTGLADPRQMEKAASIF